MTLLRENNEALLRDLIPAVVSTATGFEEGPAALSGRPDYSPSVGVPALAGTPTEFRLKPGLQHKSIELVIDCGAAAAIVQ